MSNGSTRTFGYTEGSIFVTVGLQKKTPFNHKLLHFISSNTDLTDVWQNKKKIFFGTSNVYPMWGFISKTGYYISLRDWSQPVQYLACFTTVHPKMDSRGFLPTHTTRGELQRFVWTSVFLSFLAFALNTYGFHIRFFYPTKGMLHM